MITPSSLVGTVSDRVATKGGAYGAELSVPADYNHRLIALEPIVFCVRVICVKLV
jgi:hypothetical protein